MKRAKPPITSVAPSPGSATPNLIDVVSKGPQVAPTYTTFIFASADRKCIFATPEGSTSSLFERARVSILVRVHVVRSRNRRVHHYRLIHQDHDYSERIVHNPIKASVLAGLTLILNLTLTLNLPSGNVRSLYTGESH